MNSEHSNPLLVPELVGNTISYIDDLPDLLSCACVNKIFNELALRKLYAGSMHDMRFRSPELVFLNGLLMASRERFARNMSLVKHLLLLPESVLPISEYSRSGGLMSLEKCLALRRRSDAELLLQPQGRALTSLAIPAQFATQDITTMFDLIPPPSVKHLLVDQGYCEALVSECGHHTLAVSCPPRVDRIHEIPLSNLAFLHRADPARSAFATVSQRGKEGGVLSLDKLANLSALSIYCSHSEPEPVYTLLQDCDLQFFNLEDNWGSRMLYPENILVSLQRHQNLRALALSVDSLLEVDYLQDTLLPEGMPAPWPALQVLYLRRFNDFWLRDLYKFRNLQILYLERILRERTDSTESIVDSISKCPNLEVITVGLGMFNDPDAFINMAQSCPRLRKLDAEIEPHGRDRQVMPMTPDQVSRLLHALPHVQHLSTNAEISVDDATLQNVARLCPQLRFLDLPGARMVFPIQSHVGRYTCHNLEVLRFHSITFEYSWRFRSLAELASEWRIMFPRLRYMSELRLPWPRLGLSMGRMTYGEVIAPRIDDYIAKHNLHDVVDTPLLEVQHDFHLQQLKDIRVGLWSHTLQRLREILGYTYDGGFKDRFAYFWRSDLEIRTVGWPIVPIDPYRDPHQYSSEAGATGVETRL